MHHGYQPKHYVVNLGAMVDMLEVLTEAGLDHIKRHQYKAGKYTPLDNFLNPYWIQLAEALPRWLAPNLVTLVGFCPLVVTYALSCWVSPSFETPPPRWLMVCTTSTLFFYQTLDAMDGKQARRTGSSSPLGQLFDHGCDCLACVAQTGAAAAVMHFGPTFLGLYSMSVLSSGFFMAQWEEYHTGTLPTSYGPIGVTETQYFLMVQTLGAAALGPEVISSLLASPLNLPVLGLSDVRTYFLQGWILFVSVFMCICIVKNLAKGFAEKGLHGSLNVGKDLIPVLLQNLLMAFWSRNMLRLAVREISLFSLLLLFYFSAQMILFSMARMPFPVLQKWLVPYATLVALGYVAPQLVKTLLRANLMVFGLWLLWWLNSVQEQLKRKLEIYTFCITKKYHANGSNEDKQK